MESRCEVEDYINEIRYKLVKIHNFFIPENEIQNNSEFLMKLFKTEKEALKEKLNPLLIIAVRLEGTDEYLPYAEKKEIIKALKEDKMVIDKFMEEFRIF